MPNPMAAGTPRPSAGARSRDLLPTPPAAAVEPPMPRPPRKGAPARRWPPLRVRGRRGAGSGGRRPPAGVAFRHGGLPRPPPPAPSVPAHRPAATKKRSTAVVPCMSRSARRKASPGPGSRRPTRAHPRESPHREVREPVDADAVREGGLKRKTAATAAVPTSPARRRMSPEGRANLRMVEGPEDAGLHDCLPVSARWRLTMSRISGG
jgi:hypothetical protein